MRNLIHITASCRRLSMFLLLLICFQITGNAQATQSMKTNLNVVAANGTTTLLDGNYTQYDNMYSNAVDWDDAWKMTNFGANFGILRDNVTLVIERRKIIQASDTTFYKMWNMSQGNYQLEIVTVNCNHPHLYAVLIDKYLNTKIPINLNGTTLVNFSVTPDGHSYDQDRFALIYSTRHPHVPIKYFTFDGYRMGSQIEVEWAVQDETTMENYILEHSTDGINFTEIKTVQPINQDEYKYTVVDDHPSTGNNYYRIKGLNSDGFIQYSKVVKIPAIVTGTGITIYPNPVVNKTVLLQIANMAPGRYYVTLVYPGGVVQQLKPIDVQDTQSVEQLSLPKQASPGIYSLRFTGPDNNVITKPITVL